MTKTRKTAKTKMPPVIKKWITALRSGEYEQGREKLLQDGKYCCLGVLCDLARKKGVKEAFCDRDEELPLVVRKWAGIRLGNPKLNRHSLIIYNDDKKYSFKKIADLIEKHYPEILGNPENGQY